MVRSFQGILWFIHSIIYLVNLSLVLRLPSFAQRNCRGCYTLLKETMRGVASCSKEPCVIPCSVFTSLRRGMKWVVSWSNFDLKFTDFVELPVPFSLSKYYINNIEIFFIFFMSRDLLRAKFWLSFMNLGLFRRELITELNYITTLCFENIISLK